MSELPLFGDQRPAGSLRLNNNRKARQRQQITKQCPSCGAQWQEEDREDRNLPFSNALRNYCAAQDIDFILPTIRNNPVLLIEFTLGDEYVEAGYLAAIDERRKRQHNDDLLLEFAKRLGVRAVLVTAGRGIERRGAARLHWRWMDEDKWKLTTGAQFLASLARLQQKRNNEETQV
jgi:hypothetical protein